MYASALTWLAVAAIAAAAALFDPAFAQETVRAGDKVWIDFTCRADGMTVMTTKGEVAADPADAKSGIFAPLKKYEPFETRADSDPEKKVSLQYAQAMEHEIEYQLSAAAVGARVGETRKLTLTAMVPPLIIDGERYFQVARVRTRAKEERIPYAVYREHLGDPEVGQLLSEELMLPARVAAVSNDEVTVRYEVKNGVSIETEIGRGVLKDAGDNFEIHLQAEKDEVLRVGPLVGKVADVNATYIVLDFGHPFGGKQLACEMEVKRIESGPRLN